jgi:threonine/homoserine/homoserine lactone efflux protein
LVQGVLCGLGAAIPIGSVNIEIGRRTLRWGFSAGFFLGCGAVTVDVAYALAYSVGLARYIDSLGLYWPMTIAGIALLSWIGIASLRSAHRALHRELLDDAPAGSPHGGYLTGLLMTATNPLTLGFWFTTLPALAGTITVQPQRDMPIICIGVFVGALSWVILFAGLLSLAGRFRRPWWMAAADVIGGLMLLSLAGAAVFRAAGKFAALQRPH